MKSAPRITAVMVMILLSMAAVGCATHPATDDAARPDAAAAAKEAAKKVIVAKVNDQELSMDALVKMMNNLPEKTDGPETLDDRKKRAVNSLVLLELAYQRATAMGLTADTARIEIALDNFKAQFEGPQGYADYLTRHGMTEADLRSDIERSLTINNIYTKEVVEAVRVPEEEIGKEYATNMKQFIQPEKVLVIDVYLPKKDGSDLKKKAKQLLAKIKADPARDPWKLVLDGTFNVRNLKVFKDTDRELYNAARKLKPDGLSGVIDAPHSVHIIKLREYSPERQLTLDEARPKIEEKLKGPYVNRKTTEWEESLKNGAQIDVMMDALGLEKRTTAGTGQAETKVP